MVALTPQPHPHDIPSEIERLIRASAYEFLPGKRNRHDREDVEQMARAEVVAKHIAGQPWDQIKPQVRTIVRNKSMDVYRRRVLRREISDAGVESSPARPPFAEARIVGKVRTLVKAYLWGAKQVDAQARARPQSASVASASDLLARKLTRSWLRLLLTSQPACIADIGRSLGVEDRRCVSRTFLKVRAGALEYLSRNGVDGIDDVAGDC